MNCNYDTGKFTPMLERFAAVQALTAKADKPQQRHKDPSCSLLCLLEAQPDPVTSAQHSSSSICIILLVQYCAYFSWHTTLFNQFHHTVLLFASQLTWGLRHPCNSQHLQGPDSRQQQQWSGSAVMDVVTQLRRYDTLDGISSTSVL